MEKELAPIYFHRWCEEGDKPKQHAYITIDLRSGEVQALRDQDIDKSVTSPVFLGFVRTRLADEDSEMLAQEYNF